MQRQQPRQDVVVVVPEEWLQAVRPLRIACAALSLVFLCFLIVLFVRRRRGKPKV